MIFREVQLTALIVVNCELEPGWADGGEDGMINN